MEEIKSPLKIRKSKKKFIIWAMITIFIALTVGAGGTYYWYTSSLEPANNEGKIAYFEVKSGDTSDAIAQRLKQAGFIRSSLAFKVALKLDGSGHQLKAGKYRLSPVESTQAIIDKLISGKVDLVTLQISPGITLKTLRSQLVKAGYAEADVDAALAKGYDHALLKDKPAGATLEGYIFPDTYEVDLQAKPEALLMRSFDALYTQMQDQGVLARLTVEKLTIHQGLTLASIIQNEDKQPEQQKHIAQVFLKRLNQDMSLGSDVTAIYGAAIDGQPADPNSAVAYDSPYNTRIHTGLPPGPISNFNFSALLAVANPTDTDDLYFVAGDDGTVYYAKTLLEHETNVAKHCITGCQ